MHITSLPEDLKIRDNQMVQAYDYHRFDSLTRSKINLTKNTFSFLLDGTKELVTNNKSVKIENNAFLLMKAGNCLMTERLADYTRTYKSILLFFTDKMLSDFLEKHDFKVSEIENKQSFFVGKYDDYIQEYVQSLARILKLTETSRSELLKIKFEEIMIYLAEKEGKDFLSFILKYHDSSTIRLVNVVENNKLNKLTLQELSFLSNMSLSTFKREFKKQYKTTPIKWFQEKRLEHAAFLLKTMKKRPIELYEEAGYEHLSNFVQAFKKKYNITPKQFGSSTVYD
jgi:AraC-like DNA-binding protein